METRLGESYRNEEADFSVRIVPNPHYGGRDGEYRFWIEVHISDWSGWERIAESGHLEGARELVEQHLRRTKPPNTPSHIHSTQSVVLADGTTRHYF
jgi:hypothetical protein